MENNNFRYPINENWRSVNEFIKYQISNIGRARDETGKILPLVGKTYCYVMLEKQGKRYKKYIHRLVANEFLPNPHNKPYVDHINRNPQDNTVNNLRWATPQENSMNKRKKQGTSIHKGIYFNKLANKWLSRITCNGKSIHLGYHTNTLL